MNRSHLLAVLLCTTFGAACGGSDEDPGTSPADAGATHDADDGSDAAAGNACANTDDQATLTSLDIEQEVQACVKPLVISGIGPTDPDFANRVDACLQDSLGLSAACSLCWAQFADCSADQCLGPCIADPTSQTCISCRCGETGAHNCLGLLASCSGESSDACDGV